MLSNFTHFISLMIWVFAQVLAVAICIFCSSFLFAKVFYLVFSLFKFKKHSEKQQERIFKVPQRMVDGVEYKQFPSGGSDEE